MREVTFDTPVLKIEGLEVKFDIIPVSSSLAVLLGSRNLALIVQQLHYWGMQGYGEVIDGVRWIYKPIKEWIEEVFPTFSPWQLTKLMKELVERGIVRREKLFTKHHIQQGDRFWWQPKNQTYYYSLITEKIQELADNFIQKNSSVKKVDEVVNDVSSESAETLETSVFAKTQILSNEEINNTKFSDCTKYTTNKTSTENNSKDKSHPTLPSEWENSKSISQNQGGIHTNKLINDTEKIKEKNFGQKAVEIKTNSADVELKINKNNSTQKDDVQLESNSSKILSKPKLKVTQEIKAKREKKAPWKDEAEFKAFYWELIKALPIVANSHSPQGLAQTIIKQLRCGIPHSYWDDFKAGLPIGTSTKPEWEIEPGVPYPMFVQYLREKLKEGKNTTSNEQTRNEVFRILNQPRQAKAFWGQFKRSVVNVSEQVERDRQLGVTNPNTPVWTRERIEPSIEEAAIAGDKIIAVNDVTQAVLESAQTSIHPNIQSPNVSTSASLNKSKEVFSPPDPWTDDEEPQSSMRELLAQKLGLRNLKGFVKEMPTVSKSEVDGEQREEEQPKTHISRMSVAEINDYLSDPILRKQIMPQLWQSDYELITNEYGEIIGVKQPSSS